MTEQTSALDIYGAGDDIKKMAERIKLCLPGGTRLKEHEALALSQLSIAYSLNPFSGEVWYIPGSGTMVIALQAASGVDPNVMGKPNSGIFDLACARLGLPAEQIASVGDRLDTDIAGGLLYGTKTILVLTGISTLEQARSGVIQPDWVFDGLPALTEAIRRTHNA